MRRPHGESDLNTYLCALPYDVGQILARSDAWSGLARVVGLEGSLGHVDDGMGIFTWSSCQIKYVCTYVCVYADRD